MPRRIQVSFIIIISMPFFFGAAHAEDQSSLAGIYSNLNQSEESGDLDGMELLLIPEDGGSKYTVVVQISEGELPQVMLSHIEVKNKAFDLIFKMSGTTEPEKMKCKFDDKNIVCGNSDGQRAKMKHGKSYWQGA